MVHSQNNFFIFTDIFFSGCCIKQPAYIFLLITGINFPTNKYITTKTNKKTCE